MIAELIWNIDLHSVFMKKLVFSKGGTCSAIFVEEAKVEQVPLFLLKAEKTVKSLPVNLEMKYITFQNSLKGIL